MTQEKSLSGALRAFRSHLMENEKSPATQAKYLHDVGQFLAWAAESRDGPKLDKALLVSYKAELGRRYAARSANSMLAALNAYLRFAGRADLCVKQFRVQQQAYLPEAKELTREEYLRLVRTAKRRGRRRLCCILQTICATGIRVSELRFVTVEALCAGEAVVQCKGKTRTVFLVPKLRERLLRYAASCGLTSGPVFVTRRGKPVDRTAIWREMKALCHAAGVSAGKVFPHNLRHLFARAFYALEKDIAKLADVLGHSSINTTRIYIATTGKEHRRKMEVLHLLL